MSIKVDPVPKGYHSITPTLTVRNSTEAIEFYKKAFKAEARDICYGPDGKSVMHAEIKIGDSIVMMNDEFPQMGCKGPAALGGTPVSMYLYVPNVDQVFETAVKAGAKVIMPVADMFWGDRFGQVEDPYGHRWSVATHIADPTKEEMEKAQKEWQQKQPACAK